MLNNDASVKGGVFQGRDAPDEYAIATAFQVKVSLLIPTGLQRKMQSASG